MAFCTECGHQLAEGAKFCAECGAKVNPEHKSNNRERKTVYDGEIHKCPVCGDMIAAYDAVCKSCGYEIRARKTTSVVHELSLKLEKTDNAQKKDELIRTFYIPNTKEDILEFFILALSQVKTGGMNTDAWMVKLEQAYQKAELSFYGTQEFERLKPMYEQAWQLNRKNAVFSNISDNAKKLLKSGYTWAILLGVLGLFFLLINIAIDASILNGIGVGAIAIGAFIADMVFLSNSDTKKKHSVKKKSNGGQSTGKDSEEFLHENYDDAAEYLRSLGFANIVTKPEKKSLLDTEGAVKGISIAGNSDFSGDDEFDTSSKIIIRYYSKKYKE